MLWSANGKGGAWMKSDGGSRQMADGKGSAEKKAEIKCDTEEN